ncbi:MAG TPA: condensation domain-containing protein, partial [Opitutaceae bacterium]
LDRMGLPAPDLSALRTGEYVAPRNPREQKLAAIFAEVLKVEPVGVNDSFFHLGGHSLLATRLISRVRAELKVELAMRTIFEAPTVADLAERLEQARTARPALEAGPRPERIPLSYAQERLWFISEHLAGHELAYNVPPLALPFAGPFDPEAMRRAFAQLVARHESLRTTFRVLDPERPEEPSQVIAPTLALEVPLVEMVGPDGKDHLEKHFQHQFDLAAGPLLKVVILKRGAMDHVLLINLHHIISDAWSVEIMLRELLRLYLAERMGQNPRLEPLKVQYADYACWQRRQDLAPDLAYWKSVLAGFQDWAALPYGRPSPLPTSWGGQMTRRRYSKRLAKNLAVLSNQQESTLFMTLTAALLVLLHRRTGRTDLCVWTTVAGREDLQLEDVVGFFATLLPLRVDLGQDPSGAEIVRRVKAVTLKGFEHYLLPFEHLLKCMNLDHNDRRNALVPIVVRHQNFASEHLKGWTRGADAIDRLRRPHVSGGPSPADADPVHPASSTLLPRMMWSELDFQFFGDGNELETLVEYDGNRFDAPTIEQLLEQHERVLEELVADPSRPLRQLRGIRSEEPDRPCPG